MRQSLVLDRQRTIQVGGERCKWYEVLFYVFALIWVCERFWRVIGQRNIDRAQLHIRAGHARIIEHDSTCLSHRYLPTLCSIACLLGKFTKGSALRATLVRLPGIDEAGWQFHHACTHGRTELADQKDVGLL